MSALEQAAMAWTTGEAARDAPTQIGRPTHWHLRPGSKQCVCSQCGDGFWSLKSLDAPQRLRDGRPVCLDERAMLARGMSRLDGGWWVTKRRVMPDGD